MSDPGYWQQIHHWSSTSGSRGESGDSEEWARRERESREETLREQEAAVEPTPGRDEGRHNNLEPEGEPGERGAARVPRTYPDLTEDELNRTNYTGEGVDLSPFSDYERMCRLCECYERQSEVAVVNNETYEMLSRELSRVEGLRLVASDIRPGEEF